MASFLATFAWTGPVSPPGRAQPLGPGEAYQRCMRELAKPYPDYGHARLYATLSMEQTLRDMVAQMAELARQITLASRR
jgi:hypothetical protein